MCGRYTLTTVPESGWEYWIDTYEGDIKIPADLHQLWRPRYNVAPTQTMPILRIGVQGPEMVIARWGLLPPWVQDLKGAPLINARADTITEKPSYKRAFAARRCLVPADGFFEWRTEGKTKQPFYFQVADHGLFAFAGIWERWESPTEIIDSYALITSEPNAVVGTVHDRMPVILPPEAYVTWLDPGTRDTAALQAMLRPFPADLMTARPVSARVGAVKNDDASILEPPEQPEQPEQPDGGQLRLF